jgi:hypothetical protein
MIVTPTGRETLLPAASDVEVGSRLDPPREVVSLRKWRRVRG